ncbi:hypothetical protein DPMN_170589 [Dreissena polymorpha]|uniref:Uncharacterized protein n=1 Tax=Dreissena polymorpha TaxID=45954 RepID=A0A9D4IDC2_DREPO|nr:hypothetical protein DPMN_170589 [Dreissena polymorpha]
MGVSCMCPPVWETVWQRRTLSLGLPKVPRRSERLSGTVKDCLKVSCRCRDCIGTDADHL